MFNANDHIDNEDAVVHGVFTENNLFDGSIITPTESYYIEPAHRYSTELNDNGIHSIVYKTSDVHMLPHLKQLAFNTPISDSDTVKHYCASEILHKKLKEEQRQQQYRNYVDNVKSKIDNFNDNNKHSKISKNEWNNEYPARRNRRWLPDQVI